MVGKTPGKQPNSPSNCNGSDNSVLAHALTLGARARSNSLIDLNWIQWKKRMPIADKNFSRAEENAIIRGLRTGYVVSDLHLFAGWSNAFRYLDDIHSAAACADFFVLNGDIFDFKWTTLTSVGETVLKAAEWIRRFATAHPECSVFYVLGNHDCHADFIQKLVQVSDELDNFDWNASHVQIGSALFFHGDRPIDRKDPFTRNGDSIIEKKNEILSRSYGRLIKMGAHKGLRLVFHEKRSAKIIRRQLLAHDLDNRITDVYFGHTHVPFSGLSHGGLTFHNTGSAIGNLRFNMLKVKIISDL